MMRYKTFGRRAGLRVSELALGAANFGTRWGYGAARGDAKEIFDAYVKAGGNFIDTADSYQFGESEELVGEFIMADRDYFVVATKYTLGATANDGISGTGNSRKNMIRSVEASLKRLKTDRIDLYWAHFADGMTPMEEIIRAFDDLMRAGKIHYAGLSNFPAWRISRGDLLAEIRGWGPIVGIQVEYSLAQRSAERELLPMAEALGLGAALWSPLGGGFLTGKYRISDEGRSKSFLARLVHTEKTAGRTAILDAVLAIAKEVDRSPTEVAIAWLLHKARLSTTALVPILGPRTSKQLTGTLSALEVNLSPEQIGRLSESSQIALGTPHEQAQGSAAAIAGGRPELLQPRVIPVA
jgi:aryl-alcohol dehydrogenase-like predicted oxidoreductase